MIQETESQNVIKASSHTVWEDRICGMKDMGFFIGLWNKKK